MTHEDDNDIPPGMVERAPSKEHLSALAAGRALAQAFQLTHGESQITCEMCVMAASQLIGLANAMLTVVGVRAGLGAEFIAQAVEQQTISMNLNANRAAAELVELNMDRTEKRDRN